MEVIEVYLNVRPKFSPDEKNGYVERGEATDLEKYKRGRRASD